MTVHTPRRVLCCALFGAFIFAEMSSPESFSRDPDGSRMQARSIKVGATESDSLSPPKDSVDWRYVRLGSPKVLNLKVSSKPSSTRVRVTLTDSVGKNLQVATSSEGSLSISERIDPGLYYISVSANAPVRYSLSVR